MKAIYLYIKLLLLAVFTLAVVTVIPIALILGMLLQFWIASYQTGRESVKEAWRHVSK